MIDQAGKSGTDSERLRERIERFYSLLNERDWEACFGFIDPTLREAGKPAFETYARSLSRLVDEYGPLTDLAIGELELFVGGTTKLYGERSFAHAAVVLTDRERRSHRIQERWVKATDGLWYTRMVGLATVASETNEARSSRHRASTGEV